jgi:hypothetical protein
MKKLGSWTNASILRKHLNQSHSGLEDIAPRMIGSREKVVYHFMNAGKGVAASREGG